MPHITTIKRRTSRENAERRRLIECMWEDGYTSGQIAHELGIDPKRMGTELKRARQAGYNIEYRRPQMAKVMSIRETTAA